MYTVSQLFVYPVKSLGGISLQEAAISEIGLAYDRYWMLVDEEGKFITQREIPHLALFKLSMTDEHLSVRYKDQHIAIEIAENGQASDDIACTIWGETVLATKEKHAVSEWFSDVLGTRVGLVRKSPKSKRLVNHHPDSSINFPDGGQYLIIGESAVDHLNTKLTAPVPINRFRPNIVFTGGPPHVEDDWRIIQIGETTFERTKACARCKLITIDQENGSVGVEPLQTLSTYRQSERQIHFGQYLKLLDCKDRRIQLGDGIVIKK